MHDVLVVEHSDYAEVDFLFIVNSGMWGLKSVSTRSCMLTSSICTISVGRNVSSHNTTVSL